MLDYKVSGKRLTIFIDDTDAWQEFMTDIDGDDKFDRNAFLVTDEYDAIDEAGLIGNGLEYTDGEELAQLSQAPVILVDEGAFAYMDYQIRSWLTALYIHSKVEFDYFASYDEVAPILYGD